MTVWVEVMFAAFGLGAAFACISSILIRSTKGK